jgi:hypothetical protein
MMGWVSRQLQRFYISALVREIVEIDSKIDSKIVKPLVEAELTGIRRSIIDTYHYRDREQRLINERLTRRFDISQAMNEATNRAIAAKQAAGAMRDVPQLTGKQQLALELQQATLAQRLKDS